MKSLKPYISYLLYFCTVASILSCMMLLTCESCNDYKESGPLPSKPSEAVAKDTTSVVSDSLLTDSLLVEADSTDLESPVDSSLVDSTNTEEVIDEAAEERKFIKEHFVEVKSLIPDLIEDIRYNTTHNFVGRRITGYEESVALLTVEACQALKAVADELRPKGYRIKIFDAYRPKDAVEYFRQWVGIPGDTIMKQEFYPDKDKNVLFQEGYISSRSRHCNGSTVDMTLCMKDGTELDMGGSFDFFSERSHSSHEESLTSTQLSNRTLLRETMKSHGFVVANTEWWHYRLEPEPFPDDGFNFHVASIAKLTADPKAPSSTVFPKRQVKNKQQFKPKGATK